MKKVLVVFIILLLSILAFVAYVKWDNSNTLGNGDKVSYTLNVGEELTIKLKSIESTGHELVWINSEDCKSIEYIGSEYKNSFNEFFGLTGAGGYEYWTFKCTSLGTDTVKIAYIRFQDELLIEADGEFSIELPTEADIHVIIECN